MSNRIWVLQRKDVDKDPNYPSYKMWVDSCSVGTWVLHHALKFPTKKEAIIANKKGCCPGNWKAIRITEDDLKQSRKKWKRV